MGLSVLELHKEINVSIRNRFQELNLIMIMTMTMTMTMIMLMIMIIITIFIQGAHFTKSDIQWGPVKQKINDLE